MKYSIITCHRKSLYMFQLHYFSGYICGDNFKVQYSTVRKAVKEIVMKCVNSVTEVCFHKLVSANNTELEKV